MQVADLASRWQELKKAISHKASIADATIPTPQEPAEFPKPSAEHLMSAKYGAENLPVTGDASIQPHSNVGYVKKGNKGYFVRHGAAAHRTAVEHEMSKLLDADHMLPQQSYEPAMNHPAHHQEGTFDPDTHGGTSLQEHVTGDTLHEIAGDEKKLKPLVDQWKSGDLHKLWALHYISNNGDMHGGNFKIDKDGVKAFDSDHAFHELPLAHGAWKYGDSPDHEPQVEYNPHSFSQLPSYLHPFVETDNDEGIKATYKHEQPNFDDLREHAKMIDPDLFLKFGKHAGERAKKVKSALQSADPTKAMIKLWNSHKDKTGGLNG